MSDPDSTDRAAGPPVDLVLIGAGPGSAMLVERVLASHARDWPELPLRVRLVDPHPPGGGRIWRRTQSPLLKLNSMLRDVAFFTDASCVLDGPIAPGASLAEWVREVRSGRIARPAWADAQLSREIDTIAPDEFPTRRLNNAYLEWAFAETVRRAEPSVRIAWVEDTVESVDAVESVESVDAVEDPAGGAGERGASEGGAGEGGAGEGGAGEGGAAAPLRVRLASGATMTADLVVYALGHTGTEPSEESRSLADFAGRHGLGYVAPAFTADIDLSGVPSGTDVIVRGMGLAAVDLAVLLTEGRGGRFTPRADGTLRYEPSGREPTLHLGSRRGVPYRAKITSALRGDPVRLEYLGAEFQAAVAARTTPLDFDRDAWPLIAAELLTGYYRELFTGHPTRVRGDWDAFAPRLRDVLAADGPDSQDLAALLSAHVPDPEDRFELAAFDRPLARPPADGGVADGDAADDAADDTAAGTVQQRVVSHIRADLRLRTTPEHSATQALFLTGLYTFLALAEVAPERWNARSRTHSLPKRWHSYFSYLASGPPGHRLHELVALAEAGVVRFLGGDVALVADEERGTFSARGTVAVAGSPQLAGSPQRATAAVSAGVLIDAWLPAARAATSDNALLRQLVASGRLRELTVREADSVATTGEVEVALDGSVPGAPGQFALGPFVVGLKGGAFTRPGLNSLPFRVHDRCARAILAAARDVAASRELAGALSG